MKRMMLLTDAGPLDDAVGVSNTMKKVILPLFLLLQLLVLLMHIGRQTISGWNQLIYKASYCFDLLFLLVLLILIGLVKLAQNLKNSQ